MNNKVIKASAGTGKTYTLAIEYLSLLINGADAENIAVITFTRKATAEIRAKIFENIRKILSKSENESSIVIESLIRIDEVNLKYEKTVIISKIEKIYKELSTRKDKIKITTIDSFINTIFSKFTAPEMNIYSYEIIDDKTNRDYLMKSFEKIIENKDSFIKITEFLKKYAERDVEKYVQWIEFILKIRWLFAMYREEKTIDEDSYERCVKSYKKLVSFFYSIPGVAELKEEKGDNALFLKGFSDIIKMEFEKVNKKNYSELFKCKSFWKKAAIKKADDGEIMLDLLFKEFKKDFASYIYYFESIPLFEELKMVEKIIGDVYTGFKISDRKFTHTDIAYYTFLKVIEYENKGKELSKKGNYFYEIFENSIKYLLIDEFQDTGVIQWKILKPIIDGTDRTICVGDEKQSIYAFRGGEKKLFSTLPEILEAEEKSLDTSYRSYENIIEFVNNFFFNINEDWSYKRVNYLSERKGGDVKCFLYDSKSETKCYEDMRKLIIENGDYESSAIIARTNTVLEEIEEVLSESRIPSQKDSSFSIIEHRAVKPFIYLMSYISKRDYFDLLLFLRSDIVHISEKMVQYMIENKNSVTEYIENGKKDSLEGINNKLFEILYKIRELKNQSYENMLFLILNFFNPLEKFDKISDSKNCMKLLSVMKNFSDIHTFIKFTEDNRESEKMKQEGSAENNGITMMTIHKSKGLEFETVYFHIKAGKKPPKSSNLREYIKYSKDFSKVEKLVFSNNLSDFAVEFFDNEIYNIEEKKEFDEWLNNLYVAFTRAKKNLYIFIEFAKGVEKIEEEINSFEDNKIYFTLKKGFENAAKSSITDIYYNGFSIGEYKKKIKEEEIKSNNDKIELNSNLIYDIFQKEYSYLEKDEVLSKYEMQYNQKIGVASHYYLSFIKIGNKIEKNTAYEMTMKKYGNMLGKDEINRVMEKLNEFIENNKDYFNNEVQVINEFTIYDKLDNKEYRIDKILLNKKEKKALIVDFKTGVTKDKEQLKKYKELVLTVIPEYNIETVFANIKL
jgi:ATP-dependent exoDNAse (exonuclease V) beta subunit